METTWLKRRGPIALIIAVYILLATLYAMLTHAWQSPDEPAHFNYARHIADTGRLPTLEPGNYPAEYLEEIKAARFPADLSIDPIRYESHQPPLYYLWASLLLRALTRADLTSQLLAVRLLSVALGGVLLITSHRLLGEIAPKQPWLALGATALMATMPMHVAITASANSDVLAELLTVTGALLALRASREGWNLRRAALMGLALGLAALTKFQALVGWGFTGILLLWDAARRDGPLTWRQFLGRAALVFGLALALWSPWLLRNMLTYGWGDPLALARHGFVAGGQLTTGDLVAQLGTLGYLRSYAQTTFQSFWGQFGWMAAPLAPRVYITLGAVCLVAGVSMVAKVIDRGRWQNEDQARSALLFGVWVALTTISYIWYNLGFVQFQGRYLFPALLPIAAGLALGLDHALTARSRLTATILLLCSGALVAYGLVRGDIPWFGVILGPAAGIAALAVRPLQKRWRWLAPMVFSAALGALSIYALWFVIIPQLSP